MWILSWEATSRHEKSGNPCFLFGQNSLLKWNWDLAEGCGHWTHCKILTKKFLRNCDKMLQNFDQNFLWNCNKMLQTFDQKILMKLRQCNSTDTLFHPVSSSSDNKPPLDWAMWMDGMVNSGWVGWGMESCNMWGPCNCNIDDPDNPILRMMMLITQY